MIRYDEYELIMDDDFIDEKINSDYWLECYLPQWSSRKNSAPYYSIKDSVLKLYIDKNQKPWCPDWNEDIKVSNIQTGVFSGPLGSEIGQHHFTKGLVVREEQKREMKVTPKYGYIEFRARCNISKENVAALWLIGTETVPEESAEICLFELLGCNVGNYKSKIGYGVHPFGDSTIKDCFYEEELDVKVDEWNTYSLDWRPDKIRFFLNGRLINTIDQVPKYPMQLMLNLYDLENKGNEKNSFEIDYVKVYQLKNQ